jgi:23S rRNA (uracil1939-C5)-methyltransferase
MAHERRSSGKKQPIKRRPQRTRTIEIERLGLRGEGVSVSNGITVYVPGALPGERVLCTIRKKREKVQEARIRNILVRSSSRVDPGCEAFGEGCGGCQLLHLDYASQCEWKTGMVSETLGRAGFHGNVLRRIIPMSSPDYSRNKLTLARDDRGALGMCPEHSQDVLPVEECRQEMPVNMEIYRVLEDIHLPDSVTQVHVRAQADGKAGMHFFSKVASKSFIHLARSIMKLERRIVGIGVRTYRGYEHLEGKEYTVHEEAGIKYRIPHAGFFQTNYIQAGRLLGFVTEFAEPKPTDNICEIYSGCGFFSLPIAKLAKSVTCIESSPHSVRAASENATLNNIANIRHIQAEATRGLKRIRENEFNTLIIDPPRMGCEESVLREIIRIRPKKIVYVSCSQLTLLDNLRIFGKAGYRVTKCQPVDMFPNTSHIETAVQLVSC